MDRSQQEIDRQAEQNRRKLLAAEAAALGLLLRSRRVVRTAGELNARVTRAIVSGRARSAQAGLKRLAAELASIGVDFAATLRVVDPVVEVTRAQMIARSYVRRWLAAGGATDAVAANRATRGSVERIAATESAQAFNQGRLHGVRFVDVLTLARVWDAALDRRTCPICSTADGTVVGAREPFPQGEPGGVHPWCRCTWTLVTLTETRRYQEAA